MAVDPRDPDASLVPVFKNHYVINNARTAAEGRPIYDDMEVVEIRAAGSRAVGVYPAMEFSHWAIDPETGGQVKISYAERFRRQYQQFKTHAQQTKSGTPLAHAPFLTEARRAELKALNIYTVEALSTVDGQELKNLGQGGRELKNQAQDYIAESRAGASTTQLQAEMEALRALNQTLADDNAMLKHKVAAPVPTPGADEFEDMSPDQLREYIAANTGHAPQGSLSPKTLMRMARDAKPKAT
jgi:hypothetical protein